MFGAIKKSLAKTREGVLGKLTRILRIPHWDEAAFTLLEDTLIAGDVGSHTTHHLLKTLRDQMKNLDVQDVVKAEFLLKDEIKKILEANNETVHPETARPCVILIVGVNGTGKTTSIAKLAYHFQEKGRTVLLAAADTFRAAAIDQLEIWAKRVGCEMVKHQPDADPSAVAFDAVRAGLSRKKDYVIIDTAGRLHNKAPLMDELKKICRAISKVLPGAPHEVWMVLDATTGQNAVNQAKQFKDAVNISGIILTKLDGTAKGGIVIAIRKELGIPVKYVGTGETIGAFEEFNTQEFLDGLFEA